MPKILPTVYVRRPIMLVEDADLAAAKVHALAMDPPGGWLTFSVPLSSTGNLPATFWGSNCICTIETYAQILALQQDEFPTAKVYRSHHPPDNAQGPQRYTWKEALADKGLQVIRDWIS